MTYFNIISCITALREISQLKLPVIKARAIYDAVKEMSSELEFYFEEEKKLADKYGIKDDNGIVRRDEAYEPVFDNPIDKEKWAKEISALQFTEAKYTLRPIIITDSDLKDQGISVSWLDALQDIIEFKEG